MVIISRHFLPHFCLLQLNPTYMRRILHLVSVKNILTSTGGFPFSGFVPLLLLLLLKGGHHRFVVEVQVPHEASAVATEGDQVPSTGFATCLSIVKLVEEEFKQNILIDFGRGHVESSKAIKELIFK